MVDESPADLPVPQATAGVVVRPDGPDEPRNAGVERVAGAAIEASVAAEAAVAAEASAEAAVAAEASAEAAAATAAATEAQPRGAALGPGHRGYRGHPPGAGSLLAAWTGYQAARWNSVQAADYVRGSACGSSRRKRDAGRPGPPL